MESVEWVTRESHEEERCGSDTAHEVVLALWLGITRWQGSNKRHLVHRLYTHIAHLYMFACDEII